MYVLHVRREIACFPVVVVGIVSYLIVPKPVWILEVKRLRVGQRSHPQEKIVPVGCAEVEALRVLLRQDRDGLGPEESVKAKIRGEHERATVVGIITHEKVGHRR